MDRNLVHYLTDYAEPEVRAEFLTHIKTEFSFGVAVPIRGESWSDLEHLFSSLSNITKGINRSVLVVAVINSSIHPTGEESFFNDALFEFFKSMGLVFEEGFCFQSISSLLHILWVDRCRYLPFQEKEGVGLARKIGCDILCQLYANGLIVDSLLRTTDSDASLPLDYFQATNTSAVAHHYPYRHHIEGFDGAEALELYEIHLRNYFLMLYEAESPFAFPSIGSCLAIQASSYAQVRGFPKRQAGEDFHLLNKLRKLGAIHYRKGEPISLRGRFSHRVPFGTGQSTTDIFRLLTQGDEYSLYNPASFVFLKQLMKASEQTLNVPSEQFAKAFQSWREYLILQSPSGFSAGEKLLLPDLLQAAYQQRTNYRQRIRQFYTNFDALKTLRLIHLLDSATYPPEPWHKAHIGSGSFQSEITTDQTRKRVLQYLKEREEVHCGEDLHRKEIF